MANTKFKPTAGYLFIEPLEKEVKTASGIYLPDNAGEKPQTGKVIAAGGSIYNEGHEVTAPAKVFAKIEPKGIEPIKYAAMKNKMFVFVKKSI